MKNDSIHNNIYTECSTVINEHLYKLNETVRKQV